MSKVVKSYLEKGFLLSPDAYRALENKEDVEFYGDPVLEVKKKPFKIIRDYSLKKKTRSIEELSFLYQKKFNFLRKILLKRFPGVVSIRNLPKNGSASLIGIVLVSGKNIYLEDETGLIKLSEARVDNGDVVHVEGWVNNDVFHIKELNYPEGEAKNFPLVLLFLSSNCRDFEIKELLEKYKVTYIISTGIDEEKKLGCKIVDIKKIPIPSLVELDDVKILFYDGNPEEILRKRSFGGYTFIPYFPKVCFSRTWNDSIFKGSLLLKRKDMIIDLERNKVKEVNLSGT